MAGEPVAVGAILTALAAVIGWLVRGQIRGTTADKLWDAAEEMRKEQKAQIDALEVRVQVCEEQRATQATEILNLKAADAIKDKKIDSLIADNAYLTRRVDELKEAR